MISINATLVLQIIHFLILAFILNRLMFRPIMKLIRDRSSHVKRAIDEVRNVEQQIVRLRDEFEKRQNSARQDANVQRSKLRNMGVVEAEKFLSESREKVTSIRARAEEVAEEEFKRAKPSLEGQAAMLAKEIIEKVVGRGAEV
jgi:F-type H+-transporting ATPase subunit b